MRIALLSNVNMNSLNRILEKREDLEVYRTEGYGNELGILLDKASSYYSFAPQITFVLMDLMELLGSNLNLSAARLRINDWFAQFSDSLTADRIYYLSDAYAWGWGLETEADLQIRSRLETIWSECLDGLVREKSNVRIFPYAEVVRKMGEDNAFSTKMWYMGKILLTNDAQRKVCEQIFHQCEVESRSAKKILFLDLDNTLWGGLAGENDKSPVRLSEDHSGLAYKNLQRELLGMKKQGVMLGIVSKNNEEDALEIIEKHPHMVLHADDFVVKKINWNPKNENLLEALKELNIGSEAAVFFDDNPAERELIKATLPEVAVPDFPAKPEELPETMREIYHTYFEKPYVTEEDRGKTEQYLQNAKREQLEKRTGSFETYLQSLEMVMSPEDAEENRERFLQLVNKTNQFNLTTRRYTAEELADILRNSAKRTYLYRVEDCFGDNGQVVALIVNMDGENAEVEEFAMSCRVMGRRIEYAVMTEVERDLSRLGVKYLKGKYIPTRRNAPVANLYRELGYDVVATSEDGTAEYRIEIAKAPKRQFYVTVKRRM